MNTFSWKTSSSIVEHTSILHIKNSMSASQRTALVQEILDHKQTTTDESGSEKGCWRGHPTFKDSTVTDLILTAFNAYMNSLPRPGSLSSDGTYTKFNSTTPAIHFWSNVNSIGGYNISHTHAGSMISGVIYLQSTGTGTIEFQPLNYIYKINHPCWTYNGTMKYTPEDGDILLFPSYLLHRVEPNPIDKERINIAFNVSYIPL